MSRALAILAAITWAAACASSAPPRLEVTSDVVAGDSPPPAGRASARGTLPATVSSGQTVTARYQIRNTGGRDLLLYDLALACGCRLASPLPDALVPGGEATLAVRCRAPRTPGDVVREIRLRSSEAARSEGYLRVPMRVTSGGGAEPPALYFGYVPVGGAVTRELVTGPDDVGAASPSGVRSTGDPALTVEPAASRADGRRVFLVRFAPRAPGVLRTVLTLAAGDEIPVIGVGFQNLLAFPAEVAPSGVVPTGAASVITLKGVGAEPLEITRVELPPDLTGELVPATRDREWRLAVRTRVPRTSAGEPIRIHTNAAAEPVLEIPVRRADMP